MHVSKLLVKGQPRVGIRHQDKLICATSLCPELPNDFDEIIKHHEAALATIRAQLHHANDSMVIEEDDVTYLPPIVRDAKILCVGLNYADHAAEGKQEVGQHPVFFIRYPSSFVGHKQPLIVPRVSEKYDYEAELAVVIGKSGRHITRQNALSHVLGYTLCNDGSVRDYQKRTPQWTLGKNFDNSASLGADIVTADALPVGALGLHISSHLNGQQMQSDSTSNMLFDIPSLIVGLSEVMTLHPGDIISTGTPAGVGFAREPKVWMRPGDTIEVSVEGIGTLVNPLIAES